MLGEPLGGSGVALLGRLAQREERFVASGLSAAASNGQHLVDRQVRRFEPGRCGGEGAVAAAIATQARQRDEDLRGVGDAGAESVGAHGARPRHQFVERQPLELHGGNLGL